MAPQGHCTCKYMNLRAIKFDGLWLFNCLASPTVRTCSEIRRCALPVGRRSLNTSLMSDVQKILQQFRTNVPASSITRTGASDMEINQLWMLVSERLSLALVLLKASTLFSHPSGGGIRAAMAYLRNLILLFRSASMIRLGPTYPKP